MFSDEILNLSLKSKLLESQLISSSFPRLEISSQNAASSGENGDHLESSRNRQVLTLIIPYLTVADISAIAGSCPQWQDIVNEYIKAGEFITIDGQFLEQYPVAKNRELYAEFKLATSLKLVKVPERKIASLFACFAKIKRLTMIGILILEDIKSFPIPLEALVLIHCWIEFHYFKEWILRSRDTLKLLHTKSKDTHYLKINPKNYLELDDFVRSCSHLTSLLIETDGVGVRWSGENFSFIKIEAKLHITPLNRYMHSLYFDAPVDIVSCKELNKLINLRSLTIRNWCPVLNLRPFTSLSYLKVIKTVEVKHKKKIDELKIKTVDLHYSKPPQPRNLILNLNNDCLLKVLEYVPIKDCVALAKAHRHFDQLVIAHKFTELVVNRPDNIVMCLNRGLFIRAAPFIKHISFGGNYNEKFSDFSWLFPRLNALKSLTLSEVTVLQKASGMPMGVETLCVKYGQFKHLDAYLEKLKPSLRSLKLTRVNTKSAHYFDNVQKIDLGYTDNVSAQYLHLNRQSLRYLILNVHHIINDWKFICELDNLSHLTIVCECSYDSYVNNKTLISNMESVLEAIGSNLNKLNLIRLDFREFKLQSRFLGGLRDFAVMYYKREMLQCDIPFLCSMKNLEKLEINIWEHFWSFDMPERSYKSELLTLVKSLPLLTVLKSKGVCNTWRSLIEIGDYLKMTGRTLKFNSCEFYLLVII